MSSVLFRSARAADAEAVAILHADSWRRHYRGAYADEFLDGDVTADRLAVWSRRLAGAAVTTRTVVAEADGDIVGFAHTILDESPDWGALLDNLHVAVGYQRRGIGAQLMARTASFVRDERPKSALYLWVLEQNVAAQGFYRALGARCVETAEVPPVGGVPGRLNGTPMCLRLVWSDPGALVTSRRAAARGASTAAHDA